MARVVEIDVKVGNQPGKLFYDDDGGILGGWGIEVGNKQAFRPLDQLLQRVELQETPRDVRQRVEGRAVAEAKQAVSGASTLIELRRSVDQVRDNYASALEVLNQAASVTEEE